MRRQTAKLALDSRPQAVLLRSLLVIAVTLVGVTAIRATVGVALLRSESAATQRFVDTSRLYQSRQHQARQQLRAERDALARSQSEMKQLYALAVQVGTLASKRGARLSEEESLEIAGYVRDAARKHCVPPRLILGVITTESTFNRLARSNVGALGLMQLMPATARGLSRELGMDLTVPGDLYDPEINIELGTYYLSQLIETYDDIPTALTAYNMGPYRMVGIRASFVGKVSRYSGLDFTTQ